MYHSDNISSTESDVNIYIGIAWTAIDRSSTIWKSISDKIKCEFFQAVATSVLLYGCTTWDLVRHLEKKLDGIYTRMSCTVLNKSSKQHPTKQHLYGYLPPVSQTIWVRWTRHLGKWRQSKEEFIKEILPWTHTHEPTYVGWPGKTYLSTLCGHWVSTKGPARSNGQ